MNTEIKRKVLRVKIDYLRRSNGISRRERIRSKDIHRRMKAEEIGLKEQ